MVFGVGGSVPVKGVKTKCALILGMHRSGTSLCSAACSVLGYQLGRIEPYHDQENPKGYNENFEVVALNDRILGYLNSVWCSPGLMGLLDLGDERVLDFTAEAKKLIMNAYEGSDKFVLKDPRISLLLPLWETVFKELSIELLPIVMTRHPGKVAVSQRQRHVRNDIVFPVGSMSKYTALVWFRYYQALAKSHLKALFIDSDTLHAKPEHELKRLADDLAVDCSPKATKVFSNKVLSKNLDRSQVEKDFQVFEQEYTRLKGLGVGSSIQMSRMTRIFNDNAVVAEEFLTPALTELNKLLIGQQYLRSKVAAPLEKRIRKLDMALQSAEELVRSQRLDFGVELERLQAGLLDAQAILERERSSWTKERADLFSTLKEVRGEAEALQAGLSDAQAVLERERSSWTKERADLFSTLKEVRGEAEALQAVLSDAQAVLERERSSWTEERVLLAENVERLNEEIRSEQIRFQRIRSLEVLHRQNILRQAAARKP